MSTEIKLIAGLAILIGILGLGWLALKKTYDAGETSGKAQIQILWDDDKVAIQKITDAAIAQATAERDTAVKANEAIQNDYQVQLSAANADAAQFAQRLRNAEARIAANSSSMPKAGGGQGTNAASAQSGDVVLTNALGAALAECSENSAQLDALISELRPQL